ncbi:MAG: hypothetical protein P8P30_04025 [Rickettsiales bacterium]|nr:hypothetical protein [Rickettsiales bacterium]
MTDIRNIPLSPLGRPIEQAQQRPQGNTSQQNQQQNTTSARVNPRQAPINVLPSDEALGRLITRAQEAQNQGQTLERGSILNLII